MADGSSNQTERDRAMIIRNILGPKLHKSAVEAQKQTGNLWGPKQLKEEAKSPKKKKFKFF